MWFLLSDGAPIKTGQKVTDGYRFQTVGSSAWFTNLDHGRRHQPLNLMTEKENIKFSKKKQVQGIGYKKYDNFSLPICRGLVRRYACVLTSENDGRLRQ